MLIKANESSLENRVVYTASSGVKAGGSKGRFKKIGLLFSIIWSDQ